MRQLSVLYCVPLQRTVVAAFTAVGDTQTSSAEEWHVVRGILLERCVVQTAASSVGPDLALRALYRAAAARFLTDATRIANLATWHDDDSI